MTDLKQKTKAFLAEKADLAITKIEQTPSRKLALATLIIVTGGVLVLGYFQLEKTIREPLMASALEEQKARISKNYNVFTDLNAQKQEQQAALTNLDTDGDGLPDVMETNVYKTSPYLADSDSDGKTDLQEITGGTNPNCPEGQACESDIIQEGTMSDRVSNIPGGLNIPEGLDINDPQAMLQYELEAISTGNYDALGITDPAQQRALKDYFENYYGGGSAELNLNSTAAGTLNQSTSETDLNSNINQNDLINQNIQNLTPEQRADAKTIFSQLTPDQIRQILIQGGYSQEEVDQLTDQDLQAILERSLEKF